jgi:molybdenum cofactor cytidylyltransferase
MEADARRPAVHAVVLAAGGSSRLGHPKQLVEVGGRSLLRRAVEIASAADVDSVTVVLGASADAVIPEIAGLAVRIAHNPAWRSGVGSSIRCGVRSLEGFRDAAGVLFMLCDQLRLTAAHLDRMIAAFRDDAAAIVASGYAGTAGVPAIFSSAFRDELCDLEDAQGGKQLLERHSGYVRVVPLPGGELDLDTADDLRAASRVPDGQ